MTSLFVIQGRDQGRRFELNADLVRLGRDPSNPIRLHDTEVSRRHAELRGQPDGSYRLFDLGSSNGSYVNAQRVAEAPLQSGDRIQLGQTVLIYTGGQRPAAAGKVPSAVDIVESVEFDDPSQIVQSMSHEEGSRLLGADEAAAGPWLTRARRHLQIMYRTALAVSHTQDIDQLLQKITELIFEWVEADRACIMIFDRQTGELVPKVRRDRAGRVDEQRIRISAAMLKYVCDSQQGVLTSNAPEDDRWETTASIVKLGVREAICVPMQGRYGMVGVIYIDTFTTAGRHLRDEGRAKFTEEHLKLMIAVAHQAALAVEETHFYSAMLESERLATIGQTIASLSHHIKNILQGIRGGSFLIEEGLAGNDPEVARKGWRIVEKNQERISALVMDMLTFSKERQPEMIPCQLNDIVGDVLELMASRAQESGVELVDRRAAEIPLRAFDGDGIHRAVLNVVSNAVDACQQRPNARVEVSTAWDAPGGQLSVSVADNGEGIPTDQLESIFNLFQSSKGHRGTGLGLPVSQKIVREHGGEIRVASELGHGSRFTLQWPAPPPDSLHDLAAFPTDFDLPAIDPHEEATQEMATHDPATGDRTAGDSGPGEWAADARSQPPGV